MTHPIVEGMTEAVTMAKLMRENEELRRELAEERALSADLARAVGLYCPWEHGSLKAYLKARGL